MAHLDDAIDPLDTELTEEEVARVEAPYPPRPVRGHG
jgi:hypothetical protein